MTTIITNVSCPCGWTERLIHEHVESPVTRTEYLTVDGLPDDLDEYGELIP